MAGPLVQVDTTVAAINLNVKRMLRMGQVVTLKFYVPDQLAPAGMTLIRQYTADFCRIPEAETETDEGRTVVFDIADTFPVGQLAQDVRQAQLFLKYIADGVESEYLRVNDVVEPAPDEVQLYRLTCGKRTARQTYMRVGRRGR